MLLVESSSTLHVVKKLLYINNYFFLEPTRFLVLRITRLEQIIFSEPTLFVLRRELSASDKLLIRPTVGGSRAHDLFSTEWVAIPICHKEHACDKDFCVIKFNNFSGKSCLK